ncbi:hypothetical protein E2K99_20935 [Herbaspirillum huttiense]|uniref:hypothetical protein n=1 Tax=Herbaspirillum huttiense TaxID=863372 RepID=UPI0010653416|nr:hypothetical protein [Herbaspirillum huttiense]QBP77300.1 hypothetical protein E2K99_20935 [Herbaspirillum huttiense]
MTYLNNQNDYREVNNIVGNGYAAETSVTSSLWVDEQNVFSPKRDGNKIQAFTTGKQYFSDLIEKIEGASREICIAGWQINWDAMLAPGKRLYDVLLIAARKPGMKIYIMPWDDTRPVRTYEHQTIIIVKSINGEPGVAPGTVSAVASPSFNLENAKYFSHHQKSIIIDRRYAYVGGIDVAYGRYDDEQFTLKCDAEGREVLNRYNPCIPALQNVPAGELVNPNEISIKAMNSRLADYEKDSRDNRTPSELSKVKTGKWQVPYDDPGFFDIGTNGSGFDTAVRTTLDPSRQPRMPWQDVHARIEGPSVYDFMLNFVRRWKASKGSEIRFKDRPSDFPAQGAAMIQVLRSAPGGLVSKEYSSMGNALKTHPKEDHIQKAMLNLIKRANHFIYIENQFFVGEFGQPIYQPPPDKGPLSPAAQFINTQKHSLGRVSEMTLRMTDDLKDKDKLYAPPENPICQAIIERIQRAILNEDTKPFHVYITLPVHPEGDLNTTASVAVQVFWTMQTISFGTNSLLNGIRRGLLARKLRGEKKPYQHLLLDTKTDFSAQLAEIPLESCFKYVTLLNLRNWAKFADRYVTEQIYVHTKLMIVDDLYALFGSANINDRSLSGEGDSEIAILVADGESSKADLCGDGVERPVRNFARKLRIEIWSKLFGVGISPSSFGGAKPANSLKAAIEKPAALSSWQAIQKQASENADAYEGVFDYVPRNWSLIGPNGAKVACSIIPNWNPFIKRGKSSGAPASPLRSEDKFWEKPHQYQQRTAGLEAVRGFLVALPIHWTEGEKNDFKYPTALVSENNVEPKEELEGYLSVRELLSRSDVTHPGKGLI